MNVIVIEDENDGVAVEDENDEHHAVVAKDENEILQCNILSTLPCWRNDEHAIGYFGR